MDKTKIVSTVYHLDNHHAKQALKSELETNIFLHHLAQNVSESLWIEPSHMKNTS